MTRTMLSVFCAFTFLLSACSKNDKSASQTVLSDRQKIQQKKWCTAESVANMNIISQFAFENEKQLKRTYIVLEGTDLFAYAETKDHSWDLGTETSYITNNVEYKNLSDLDWVEKRSLEDQTKLHENIFSVKDSFKPRELVIVRPIKGYSARAPEILELFPCSDYSVQINKVDNFRPMEELGFRLAQSHWLTYTSEGPAIIARVGLTYPFKKLNPIHEPLRGTQWCSWHAGSGGSVYMEILTLGEDQAYTQHVTDFTFSELSDERRAEKAKEVMSGTIKNRKLNLEIDFIGYPSPYSLMEDASGTQFLMSGNYEKLNFPLYTGVMLPCLDPRPLQYNSDVKAKLPAYLELLRKNIPSEKY